MGRFVAGALLSFLPLVFVHDGAAASRPNGARRAFEERLLGVLASRGRLTAAEAAAIAAGGQGDDARVSLEAEIDRLLRTRGPATPGEDEFRAGYRDGFTVSDAANRFEIRFRALLQFRYEAIDTEGGVSEASAVLDQDRGALARPATTDTQSLSLRRARLFATGHVFDPDLVYRIFVEAQNEAVSLQDAFVEYAGFAPLRLRAGQFKVPMGREALSSSSELPFNERSRVTTFFAPARDGGAGVIAHGAGFGAGSDLLEGSVGAFDGEGKNVSGNDGPGLLYSGRLVLNPLGSPGPETFDTARFESPRAAMGAAVTHLSDAAGAVRFADGTSVSLRHPGTTVVGIEAAAKWLGATLQGEAFRSRVDPEGSDSGDIESRGAYATAAYVLPGGDVGFAFRYGEVLTEESDVLSTPSGRFDEWSVGATWFIRGTAAKVLLDWTRYGESVRGEERIEDDAVRLQLQVAF